MNENYLANEITRHLNQGLALVAQDTTNKLQATRHKALGNYGLRQPAFNLAWANTAGHIGHGAYGFRRWLSIFALISGLLAVGFWEYQQHIDTIDEIDAALLSEELPVHAYLDEDFAKWLEHSSQ